MRNIKERRPLTADETALARSVFGSAIDYSKVTIVRGKWFPLQPRHVVMAPCGHIHFHPRTTLWSEDFSREPLQAQGLFIHEMTHVWQSQERGLFYLPLMRHPFCRYHYSVRPSWPLRRYGVEQQAEIVRHYFLLREGAVVPGAPPIQSYRSILPWIES